MRQEQSQTHDDQKGDVLKGLVAGAIAGLVASFVMNQFQAVVGKAIQGDAKAEKKHGAQSLQDDSSGTPQDARLTTGDVQQNAGGKEDDNATERLAAVVSEQVFGHQLTDSEKETAGAGVHYAFGTSSGAFYGAIAELVPQVTAGAGMPFGAFVWLTADEGMVPLLGLSKPPQEYPLSTHVYALSSHLVYGLTAEVVRRAARHAL